MCANVPQLPYIEHGNVRVPDSAFIIRYLANTYPEKVPKLSADQQAISAAATALLEARILMGLGMARWLTKEASSPVSSSLLLHRIVLHCRVLHSSMVNPLCDGSWYGRPAYQIGQLP
jgi:glutathione S-transferase